YVLTVFFFQAEDGIRGRTVTGVQTCALPILAGFRSEWRTDFLFGNTYGIASELYRPFKAASKWFFAPHADASDIAFQIYAKNDPLADYRFYRMNAGADMGYGFSRFSEVRFGYEVGHLSTKLRLGTPQIAA